ncbi:MAG: glucokinase [Hyphomonadaceae bacterium]|jgi:glucokinase|uniref:glucokinase n=1 Tax=Aquidulcibacter sp. TaxID=2052990 RepID=UPI0022BE3BB8|nr:glucokinase [Aquidulcibacter sp.]MCZ8207665.1 glucokinase [Aquidulcibacter sp.]
MSSQAILVGDVGGTNVRLAIAHIDSNSQVELSHVERMPVLSFPSLEEAIEAWQAEGRTLPSSAVFALAGPTGADEVHFTNSSWVVSASATKARFGFQNVTLVNDFAAQARAVPSNNEDAFEVLIEGEAQPGAPIVVLGPGTGLGMALLVPDGRDWSVISTEGGHQAYAPVSARERQILEVVAEDLPYISYENLVSGLGLDRLYKAIAKLEGRVARLKGGDEIGPAAIAGDDPSAVEAVEVMIQSLATFAGNAILATGARGGCVIAGGVSEALAPFMRTSEFVARLLERGPISGYLNGIPVRRARNAFAALEGAAFFAPKHPF